MVRVRYSFSSRRTGHIKNIRKQKKKIPNLVKEIIEVSDIILEILDARFLQETRNRELEELIKNQGKMLIYVINKTDLVTLKSKILEISSLKIHPYILVSCKKRKGVSDLKNKIKIESKKFDTTNKRVQVGIIGYPNTGKSSIINALSKKSSAKTGSEAGFTKGVQKIRLSSDILLLDTPGIIPESEYSHTREEAIKKHARIGARTSNTIRDPEMIVNELMKEFSNQIEKFYKIDAEGDPEVLIEKLGKKKGFLKKGGVVDEDRISRLIIQDWQKGRIRI